MVAAPDGPGHEAGPFPSPAPGQDRFPPRPPRQASGRPGRRSDDAPVAVRRYVSAVGSGADTAHRGAGGLRADWVVV